MSPTIFLLLNLALAFYNVGTIWAHEVDIFRSWKLVDPTTFHRVQLVHWRKLRYWVLLPFGLSLVGSISLVWYRPAGTPPWAVWSALCSQLAAHILTLVFWARWQAKLSKDDHVMGVPVHPSTRTWRRVVRSCANELSRDLRSG